MNRKSRQKALELGLALLNRAAFDKRVFLEANTALTQQETANTLGIRARDIQKVIQPDYVINGRPKYKMQTVLDYQNALIKRSKEVRNG